MKDSYKKLLRTEIKGIPHEYQWAAFLLPVFLLIVAFASWKVHPLGETSLLTCDLFHQYAPILAEIRSKILSGDSLFYTWNMGSGTNFWPILSYNGASPLNIILLLFPQAYLSDGITLLILIRTGLSGLFFSLLIYRKDGREGAATLALSTAYALSGYVLAYFWALMWMDAVMLLPLVVLGLWKIFTGEKPRLYVAALFLLIFSNFYFGFFACFFLLLFAPVLYMEARQKSVFAIRPLPAVLRFTGYSILSAGMTAVLLLPTVIALRTTAAAADSLSLTPDLSFTFFDFLSRFLLHADPVIREGLPNVYCSVAILLLILLYAMCRTISFSLRAVNLGLAFLLYISMDSQVLNFFWHGMHYTNQIPYRQAFLMCFLLLYMANQVIQHMDGLSRSKVCYAGAAVLIYLFLLDRSQSAETQKNYWLIYGSAAFVIAYMVILSGFFTSEKGRKWAQKAFLYAIILELFFASEFAVANLEKTEHLSYAPAYGQFQEEIAKDLAAADGGQFSRTILLPALTGNDGALYHVKTTSIFASTTSEKYVQFMASLGFANNQKYEVNAEGLTEVSARLLGIRNTVQFTGGQPVLQKITAAGTSALTAAVLGASAGDPAKTNVMYSGYNITSDDSVLPLGFFVPSAGILTELNFGLSPFEQTNALFERMGVPPVYGKSTLTLISSSNIVQTQDADNYLIQVSGQTSSISLNSDIVSGEKEVLLYPGTRQELTVRVSRMNRSTGANTVTVLTPLPGQIIDCGKSPVSGEETMTIQLVIPAAESETFPIYCYSIDSAALDAATKTLSSQPMTVTSFDTTRIAGSVDFAEDGSLFTSIPYDAGWSVKIDGAAVKTQAAYGALLSVPVTKGFHEINFSYQPPGFIPGLLISLVLIADFILLSIANPFSLILSRRKGRKESARTEEKEE
ncbi:MAG: YfhO family protein [Eubacteriales bacterium]